jgi:uncharacterized coiled-coil protein SlyX
MKRDEIEKRLGSIDVTLAKQSTILEEHIRRTAMAEERIDLIQSQIDPLKSHVAMVAGAIKFVGFVGVLAGIVAAVVAIIRSAF